MSYRKKKESPYERIPACIFSAALLLVLLITAFEAVCYWLPGIYRREMAKYDTPELLAYWRQETMTLDDVCEVMDQTMLYLRGDREDLIVEVPISGRVREFYNDTEKSHMADVREVFLAGLSLRRKAGLACLLALLLILILEKAASEKEGAWTESEGEAESGKEGSRAEREVENGSGKEGSRAEREVENGSGKERAEGAESEKARLAQKMGRRILRLLSRACLKTSLLLAAGLTLLGLLAAMFFDRCFTIFHEIFFSQGNWLFDPYESRMIDIMPEEFFADMALYVGLAFAVMVTFLILLAYVMIRKTKE